jgi:hypothetical protein
MGNSQSTNVQQTLQTVNSAVTNIVNKTENTTNTTTINTNTFSLEIGEGFEVKGRVLLDLGQRITASQAVTVNSAVTNTAALQTAITSALKASAESMSESKQGALAAAMNIQNTNQSLNQLIANYVTTNVTNETVTNVNNIINNANNGTIVLRGKYAGDFTLKNPQEIISDQIAKTVTSSLTDNQQALSIANKMDAENKTSQKSTMQGLIDALSKLIGSAGLAIALVAWGPCILITICCCACAMGKKGSSSPPPAPAPAPAAFGKRIKSLNKTLKIIS